MTMTTAMRRSLTPLATRSLAASSRLTARPLWASTSRSLLPFSSSSSGKLYPVRGYATADDATAARPGPELEGEQVEKKIVEKLREALKPTHLGIADTSGGCGQFFNIDIESAAFDGLSKVKQHKLVQDVIKEEIANMHGVSLRTATPSKE